MVIKTWTRAVIVCSSQHYRLRRYNLVQARKNYVIIITSLIRYSSHVGIISKRTKRFISLKRIRGNLECVAVCRIVELVTK